MSRGPLWLNILMSCARLNNWWRNALSNCRTDSTECPRRSESSLGAIWVVSGCALSVPEPTRGDAFHVALSCLRATFSPYAGTRLAGEVGTLGLERGAATSPILPLAGRSGEGERTRRGLTREAKEVGAVGGLASVTVVEERLWETAGGGRGGGTVVFASLPIPGSAYTFPSRNTSSPLNTTLDTLPVTFLPSNGVHPHFECPSDREGRVHSRSKSTSTCVLCCSERLKIKIGLVCSRRTRSSMVRRPSDTAVRSRGNMVSRPGKPGGGESAVFSDRV
mmetsp:Transcript_36486/g.85616  ORF Transcript_36486/g.85616 Transcript_36486/m.85616 type:complete len:278 (-) Transcript_36486:3428-4261(-)